MICHFEKLSIAAFAALLNFTAFVAPSRADAVCTAPDISSPNAVYSRIACRGVELQRQGRYTEAAEAFREAMDVQLHEFPNFVLFARLATVLHLAGDRTGAHQALGKGKLALSVWTGAVICEQAAGEPDYLLRERRGGSAVVSPYASEIMDRMCGAAYESYYGRYNSFDELRADAALLEELDEAEAAVSARDRD